MRQKPPGSGPKYDGNCAFAVRLGKVGVPAQHEAVIDGTVYRFKNVVAKWLFNVLPNSAQKADANWAEAQDRRRTGSRADPSREGGPGV